MKHLWFGLGLLLVLLVLGSVLTSTFTAIHTPLSQALTQAADHAHAGRMEQALASVSDAQRQWEACRNFSAAVVDHRLLEEMEELFAQLRYTQRADEITALCARLASRAEEMAESQSITWWNLM